MSDKGSTTITIDASTENAMRRLYEMRTNADGDSVSLKMVIYTLVEEGMISDVRQLKEARDNPVLEDSLSEDRNQTSGIEFRDNRADFSEL